MSAATADTWTGSGPVEEEGARIVCALLDHVDDDRFFDDVGDQVSRHYRTKLSSFLEGRIVTRHPG